ncbi:MAG: hypothetical protein JXQ89_19750 [Pelagimonas sp.]
MGHVVKPACFVVTRMSDDPMFFCPLFGHYRAKAGFLRNIEFKPVEKYCFQAQHSKKLNKINMLDWAFLRQPDGEGVLTPC